MDIQLLKLTSEIQFLFIFEVIYIYIKNYTIVFNEFETVLFVATTVSKLLQEDFARSLP